MRLFTKINSLFNGIIGELIKVVCLTGVIHPLYEVGNRDRQNSDYRRIIVSLTSYGRRVSAVLYYTLISLLRQTKQPDMIILWLDHDNWNDSNLPRRIKKLKKYGIEIRYCDDIKSYKKLIPTLELYPDELIITCDDDIFYKSTMIEKLYNGYLEDPSRIYAHRGHRITINEDGRINPYYMWEKEISGDNGYDILPTCGAGCLYSKELLFKDTCKRELFMMLAPHADDLWFYFMAYLQNTPIYIVKNNGYIYYEIDFFYQRLHKSSSLYSSNIGRSQNDIQIDQILSYYDKSLLPAKNSGRLKIK